MITSIRPTKLEELLAGEHLPALPDSAIRLLKLSQDPENGPPEFAVPIEADLGLTGQVLKYVNSSYFGLSRDISSVQLAIALVGVKAIKNFALWSAIFSLMPNPRCGPFKLRRLWQDSLRRGLFARELARHRGLKNSEDLFTAGLLQDMAVPILAREMPEEYAEMLEQCHNNHQRLSELESERFGWNHAEASAILARHWRLPESFADCIRTHNQFDRLVGDSRHESAAIVALSALLPASVETEWHERAAFKAGYEQLGQGRLPELEVFMAEIDATYESFAPVMRAPKAERPLVDWLEDTPPA